MIDKNSIDILTSSVNIVELISNYLELKRSGTGTYKANCPFHNEKTASFVVSETKQIYHCFGCSAGGNIYSFMMEYEKLNFVEAVEKIADIYNFKLTYTNNSNYKKIDTDMFTTIQKFLSKNLENDQANMNYLKMRGLSDETIKKFGIGIVYNGNDILNIINKNYDINNGVSLGLLGEGNGRVYSRFSYRIMFPIYNERSNLIGYGGRTTNNHEAKYINSPQSKLFDKSRVFYALNIAKDNIYRDKKIVITEGYMDTISMHQAGITTAVATLGTALTHKHIPILKKYDALVILSYDGDKAGITAAYRATMLLLQNEVDGGVVLFDNGSDPADYVKNGSALELIKKVDNPVKLIDFYLKIITKDYDTNNPSEKSKLISELSIFLKSLTPVYQDSYSKYISVALNIPINYFKLNVKNSIKTNVNNDNKNIPVLSIIKTLLVHNSLIDDILEYIDSDFFYNYSDEFNLLKSGEYNNPLLRKILIDDKIIPFNKDEFESELKLIQKTMYIKEREDIGRNKNISYNEKIFKIRKLDELIIQLK